MIPSQSRRVAFFAACLFAVLVGAQGCTENCIINCNYFVVEWSVCGGCDLGYYVGPGGASCLPCPAGQFNGNGVTCNSCNVGTYSTAIGATSGQTCLPCSAGTSSLQIGANSSAACQPCPAGLFAAAGSAVCKTCDVLIPGCLDCLSATSCAQCDAGYALSAAGLCSPCNAGSYGAAGGVSSCTACPVGSYSDSNTAAPYLACTSCPTGSPFPNGNPSVAQTSIAYCYGTPIASSACVTFSPSNPSVCVQCAPGFVAVGTKGACTACSTLATMNGCEQCQLTHNTGGRPLYTCTECASNLGNGGVLLQAQVPAVASPFVTPYLCCFEDCAALNRQTCGGLSPYTQGACGGCTYGYYQGPASLASNGTLSDPPCVACPANTYNAVLAQMEITACTACPANTFSPPGSTSVSECN